ncbi:MAG: hypothetical protein K2K91_02765 [Ruminococcus sp.]|nr:hypothetical protein [Ruminococcus sp.]MDE7099093.1 hypothetical protein [Ruminococcus sp.]
MKLPDIAMANINNQIKTGTQFTKYKLQNSSAHITRAHGTPVNGTVSDVYFYTISAGNQGWWGITKNVLQQLQNITRNNPNTEEAYVVVVDKSTFSNISDKYLNDIITINDLDWIQCLIFDVNTIQQQLKLSETDTAYQFTLQHLKDYKFMPLIQAVSERIDASII